MHARLGSRNNASLRVLALAGLIGSSVALTALAQPGRGPSLSPEDQAKVSTAQISAVAADLKLDPEKSAKLAEAVAAFDDNETNNSTNRPERGDWEAMRKAHEARVGSLETSLKTFLDDTQAGQTAPILAGRNRGWDNLVLTVLGFGLEAPKEAEALGHTLAFVKDTQGAARGQGNRENVDAMREKMAEAKKTLDENLAPLLTDEQKATWTEKTTRRPRDGGRGGDDGDRRRRGADRSE